LLSISVDVPGLSTPTSPRPMAIYHRNNYTYCHINSQIPGSPLQASKGKHNKSGIVFGTSDKKLLIVRTTRKQIR
jgi:hypothetical protein